MLIPAEIILDNQAATPINAIHTHSGLKADLYPVREGLSFDGVHSDDGTLLTTVPHRKDLYPFARGSHSA